MLPPVTPSASAGFAQSVSSSGILREQAFKPTHSCRRDWGGHVCFSHSQWEWLIWWPTVWFVVSGGESLNNNLELPIIILPFESYVSTRNLEEQSTVTVITT